MLLSFSIHKAGRIIRNGGIVAYPTEGVFGLGCLPDNLQAIERVLTIKQRDPSQGLILIAASNAQLDNWIDTDVEIPCDQSNPVTWVVPASDAVPPWITGRHADVAVRITSNPVAAALCVAAGSALVSTSANVSGHAPAANTYVLRRQFHDLVDYIVPGRCGPSSGSSEIRDLMSNTTLRPAGS
jgi:L-threonylcarbamoyladenylate synthase